ncbi:unnamed protein product [Calypogeia fissa]
MDHIPVVEKERVVREGRAVHDVAGISNPPTGIDRPPTPKAPRWAEPDRVAIPSEQPVGEEAVDDVLSDITAGPEDLGPHESPEGLTQGENAEAPNPAGQGDNQEPEVIILDPEENMVLEGDKAPEEEYAPEDNAPRNKEEEEMQFFSIPRDIVREAEEVRGGSNWAKHLFKQLHHELEVAKTTKKCRAGCHIRIIFLALEREKKKKEAAKEDAPPRFPAPQGTKVLQGFGMTTLASGAKPAMRGAAGAKAKPPPKKIIVKAKPPQPNPRQVLGIKVKPPQKNKPEVVAPGPDGQPPPPSPTNAEVEVALEPLPLFNRGEAPLARKKRQANGGKRSSSQETASRGVNSKPERSQNPEDYPKYIREVIMANEGGCEDTPFEKMCQVTTKSFCQGLIDSLYPQKDVEIQVLTNTNNSFKAIIDSNEKDLMELGEERDKAVLDAANATSKVEALMEKIKELEGKLLTLQSAGSTPNKRPHDS